MFAGALHYTSYDPPPWITEAVLRVVLEYPPAAEDRAAHHRLSTFFTMGGLYRCSSTDGWTGDDLDIG